MQITCRAQKLQTPNELLPESEADLNINWKSVGGPLMWRVRKRAAS